MQNDTIAAIATPPGTGGIAVIRISGADCFTIAQKVFKANNKKSLADMKGYTAVYGNFYLQDKIIDDGIALCFVAPHSYTGEDTVEFSCHGGEEVSKLVLRACFLAGAAPAEPGEYTKRAVLNGRMDLSQAEAVMDIISSTSEQGVAMASAAMHGALYKKVDAVKNDLIQLSSHMAAIMDYPEEGVEDIEMPQIAQRLNNANKELLQLLSTYRDGMTIKRGVKMVIAGSPNVGKSTLFNLLSRQDRAIVTEIAGTTRDVIQEQIQLNGIPFWISDTAGMHDTQDVVEQKGIERTQKELEQASLILAVYDSSSPLQAKDIELAKQCAGKPSVAILNKVDLGVEVKAEKLSPYFTQVVLLSAKEEEAYDILKESILKAVNLSTVDTNAPLLANERQLAAVLQAQHFLQESIDVIAEEMTMDAVGILVQEAITALMKLTGENVSDEVIDAIFENFCVGK